MLGEQSVRSIIQEELILLADFARLLERTRAFLVQTAEIVLNVLNIELEVLPNDNRVFPHCQGIVRHKRPYRRKARFGLCVLNRCKNQEQNPREGRAAQPEVSQTPYFLEYTHYACLMGARPQYSRNT